MKYGLIGKTLVHSYSKEIHEALGKYQYDLFSLAPEELAGFIAARDFGGLNITIPYKQDVMPLCDEVSELAAAIGAVNTLYWKKTTQAERQTEVNDSLNVRQTGERADARAKNAPADHMGANGRHDAKNMPVGHASTGGRYHAKDIPADHANANAKSTSASDANSKYKLMGHNTDYEGFLYTADRSGIDFTGKTVLILGSGGTSLMARKAAVDRGASNILIASRRKQHNLQDTETMRLACQRLSYDDLPAMASGIDIIVNTTPVGTYPNNLMSIISLDDFPNCTAVIDVIYNPFRTKLLLEAEKKGLRYANGLPMLVAQATAAAGYFLGTPGAFYAENEQITATLKKQMQNIILIGMPGCGKTTIGRIIAEKSGKKFADMDEEIVKKSRMPIPQIFKQSGEKGFRDLESEVARQLGKERGLVIATGGGAVLRPENVDALRQNGFVIHIKRPLDALPLNGRPLSKDLAALQKMEESRMPLYKAIADATFSNSQTNSMAELAESLMSSNCRELFLPF